MGRVKLAIFWGTFDFAVTASIVKGNVTIDEHVEKAVSNAEVIPLKWMTGFNCPINFNNIGKLIKA